MKTIRLLLTDNVDNLGIVGDVVEVKPGYARNFLLPRNLATNPTEGAIKRLAVRRAQVELEMKERRAQLEAILAKLAGHEITVQRSANEQGVLFGGVSQHEIAQILRDDGYPVDDRVVRIGQQIKRLDSYQIPIVLANDLKTEIKLWVVSDKPLEQQEQPAAPAAAGAEPAADEGAAKPKGKKAKAEAGADTAEAAPAEGEAKPRKKARKAEGEAPAPAAE